MAEPVTLQTSDHKMTLEDEVKELRLTVGFMQKRIDQLTVFSMQSLEQLKKSNEKFDKILDEIKKVSSWQTRH